MAFPWIARIAFSFMIVQGVDRRRPDHFRKCRVCHPEIERWLPRRKPRLFNNPFSIVRLIRRAA
jgi:hypothetical protein